MCLLEQLITKQLKYSCASCYKIKLNWTIKKNVREQKHQSNKQKHIGIQH